MRNRPHIISGPCSSTQSTAVVDLVYTLIHQLISYIPDRLERRGPLSYEAFRTLNGGLPSVEPALEVLANLLHYIPPYLVCVIDGLEEMETHETMPYLNVLMDTLRAQSMRRTFKILFTTSGPSQVLYQKIQPEEYVSSGPPLPAVQNQAGSHLYRA
ncbi:hypothetical protein F4781DRAFT_387460 [Annulohypoxylon bovei var. microspora]|nr:hypothetical protein F4781DRAFT_387460 [Annulohypoxylon bovei var. microspora]